MFIHGRVSTQMTLLAAELPCMKRPVLLPVLYVEIVVYLHCISQLGLQKTKQNNPTIDLFSVSRKSLGIPVHL